MHKGLILTLTGALCAFCLALPAAATPTRTGARHTAVSASAVPMAWAPEMLSGKIEMVIPAQRLIVVQAANGIPFDMIVGPGTRIVSGDQRLTIQDLRQYENHDVRLRFIPERRGDVAQSIHFQG